MFIDRPAHKEEAMQSDSSKAYENARAEYERLSGQPAFIRLIRRKKLDEAETDMRERSTMSGSARR